MQFPPKGSFYPTRDPDWKVGLEVYVYTGSIFGFMDTGSLSCLAKTKFTELYKKHFPMSIHKIPNHQLIQINDDLRESYVNDIHVGSGLMDVHNELKTPSFLHSHVKNWDKLRITQQSAHLTIALQEL